MQYKILIAPFFIILLSTFNFFYIEANQNSVSDYARKGYEAYKEGNAQKAMELFKKGMEIIKTDDIDKDQLDYWRGFCGYGYGKTALEQVQSDKQPLTKKRYNLIKKALELPLAIQSDQEEDKKLQENARNKIDKLNNLKKKQEEILKLKDIREQESRTLMSLIQTSKDTKDIPPLRLCGVAHYTRDDWKWAGLQAYSMHRYKAALQYFNLANPALFEGYKLEEHKDFYCDFIAGRIMRDQLEEQREASPVSVHLEQCAARAFRDALQKCDEKDAHLDKGTTIEKEIVENLEQLKKNHQSFYGAWELVSYYFKKGNWDKVSEHLNGVVLCSDIGFSYTNENLEYMLQDPVYKRVTTYDYEKVIDDKYKQAVFLNATSQLAIVTLWYKNQMTQENLVEPLRRANLAALLILILFNSSPDTLPNKASYPSFRWWQTIIQAEYDLSVLREALKKIPVTDKKAKVQKMKRFINNYPNMNINQATDFIEVILNENKEINQQEYEKYDKTNLTIKWLFALQQFRNSKDDVKQKQAAIEKLKKVAEDDIFAANILGMLCAGLKHTFSTNDIELEKYNKMAQSSLLKVYCEVEELKPKLKRTEIIDGKEVTIYNFDMGIKNYFPLQGNPCIHAELAQMYFKIEYFDGMVSHLLSTIETCPIGFQDFLTRTLDTIFGHLYNEINVNDPDYIKVMQKLSCILKEKLEPHKLELSTMPNYLKLMSKCSPQETKQNT